VTISGRGRPENRFHPEKQWDGMSRLDLQDCESCGDVVQNYPLAAGAVAVLIGALAYAGSSLAINGVVRPAEIALFAAVFGVGYTAVRYLWAADVSPFAR